MWRPRVQVTLKPEIFFQANSQLLELQHNSLSLQNLAIILPSWPHACSITYMYSTCTKHETFKTSYWCLGILYQTVYVTLLSSAYSHCEERFNQSLYLLVGRKINFAKNHELFYHTCRIHSQQIGHVQPICMSFISLSNIRYGICDPIARCLTAVKV